MSKALASVGATRGSLSTSAAPDDLADDLAGGDDGIGIGGVERL